MAKSKSWLSSLQEYNPLDVLSKKLNPSPTEISAEQQKKKRQEALMNPTRGSSLGPSPSVVKKATDSVRK